MANKDPRIDAYIKNSNSFARPILKHLREMIHDAVPEVVETLKWGMPAFDYKGPIFSMASFKEHCAFAFWKSPLMKDAGLFKNNKGEGGMGDLGKIRSLDDLPNDKLMKKYLLEAKKLNDLDVRLEKRRHTTADDPEMHPEFEKQLKKNKNAFSFFQSSSPSCRREYNTWINEAKRDETRSTRIATAVEWLGEGKGRNWKYAKKK